jgi:hypothetical protein
VTGRYGAFFVFETKSDFNGFVASELFETISSHRSIRELTASDRGYARAGAWADMKASSPESFGGARR